MDSGKERTASLLPLAPGEFLPFAAGKGLPAWPESRREEGGNVMEFFLAIFGVCLVFALLLQWKLLKRSEVPIQREIDVIEGILAMKEWMRQEESLLSALANHPDIEKLEAVEGPKDLLCREILFDHLEKIYLLVQGYDLPTPLVERVAREIELWLQTPGMKRFFGEFSWKQRNHVEGFLTRVRKYYENAGNGFSFDPLEGEAEETPTPPAPTTPGKAA
ncbi:MAG: hypothetical protein D6812_12150 [Deltaproteobacteria bacterium]|nr:MAG: hypothetical protein D6812_12150 [Deltaproteobacteria bacterium]